MGKKKDGGEMPPGQEIMFGLDVPRVILEAERKPDGGVVKKRRPTQTTKEERDAMHRNQQGPKISVPGTAQGQG